LLTGGGSAYQTTRKKKYAEDQLAKLDGQMKLADAPPVKEQITDEERYMFQKLGLRMRARLLLGMLTATVLTKCGELLLRFLKHRLPISFQPLGLVVSEGCLHVMCRETRSIRWYCGEHASALEV